MRFLPVAPDCTLIELPDLAATLALFDALEAAALPEVAEVIPAARTLMLRLRPGFQVDAALAARLRALPPAPARATETRAATEIPVTYDGADLEDVARLMQLSPAEVVAAHQTAEWQVAFCGFAPGFAYLTCDDPRFDLPRRASPRARIPAGSVALAGRFGGVYPQASPGGWQLIGTTNLPMWDVARDPPALLQPGGTVRFVARHAIYPAAELPPKPLQGLRILSTAFPITVQDTGRPGRAAQGVARSGAMDPGALRRANRMAGNPPKAAALELTLGPIRLTVDQPVELALAGAIGTAVIEGSPATVIDIRRPFALDAGEVLALTPPAAGMRGYLARRGGFVAPRILGSAARDTLAALGPEALVAGDVIGLDTQPAGPVTESPPTDSLPAPGDVVTLPVTLGPRTDWFPADQVALFLSQTWEVTPEASRTGLRLGGQALSRPLRELPSEGTAPGAIQIPHSGLPVLFLADHPLTGGYPVIATLLPEALTLAGQLPPGARIRFAAAHPFAEIAP
ncbi:MAG: 5-oxoprolinase/urea amidolyase family protein [Gemmobacter sp.]|nr:5-oxoprolinase/urea amidolyase family protein [Gemmobacter sp.]